MKTNDRSPRADGSAASRFSLDALGGTFEGAEIALTDLIETCADAIVLIDEGQVIRYWNRGAEALFQYARDEVVGRAIGFLVPADLHEPIRQDAVLLTAGRSNLAAQALLDYLKSAKARQVIRSFGYAF